MFKKLLERIKQLLESFKRKRQEVGDKQDAENPNPHPARATSIWPIIIIAIASVLAIIGVVLLIVRYVYLFFSWWLDLGVWKTAFVVKIVTIGGLMPFMASLLPWIVLVMIGYLIVTFFIDLFSTDDETNQQQIQEQLPFLLRQEAVGFKAWPIFRVRPFWGGAIQRMGVYHRVVRPGQYYYVSLENHVPNWEKRTLGFLGGWYFKLPFLEQVDFEYMGTRKAKITSISINSAGFNEPEKVTGASDDLAKIIPINVGQEIASANGPQVQVRFFVMCEVFDLIAWLRLDKATRDSILEDGGPDGTGDGGVLYNSINATLQNTLPDVLVGDAQRWPSKAVVLLRKKTIKAIPDGESKPLRQHDAIEFLEKELEKEPYCRIDERNLDSAESRRAIAELLADEKKRDCLLGTLMSLGGLRFRQFRMTEVEPEREVRAAITRKGVAQVGVETAAIEGRQSFIKEYLKQQERILSAKTDGEKVRIISDLLKLEAHWTPILVMFFQEMRTREEQSRGPSTTIVLGDVITGLAKYGVPVPPEILNAFKK